MSKVLKKRAQNNNIHKKERKKLSDYTVPELRKIVNRAGLSISKEGRKKTKIGLIRTLSRYE